MRYDKCSIFCCQRTTCRLLTNRIGINGILVSLINGIFCNNNKDTLCLVYNDGQTCGNGNKREINIELTCQNKVCIDR